MSYKFAIAGWLLGAILSEALVLGAHLESWAAFVVGGLMSGVGALLGMWLDTEWKAGK